MNDTKTKFLVIGSRRQLTKIKIDSLSIRVCSTVIQKVSSVRDLGAWFDTSMTMTTHIGKACSKGFFGLYKIKQIRKCLSEKATATLIHAFVTSHLDYCNSLLYVVPMCQIDRLQKVLNAAARVTRQVPRYKHLTPVLKSLHWLSSGFRIKFKIALLIFKTLKGMASLYLSRMLQPKPTSRYSLRSNNENLLIIPRTICKTFGDRAFAVAGPKIWKSLPVHIREAENLHNFKNELKTHLFKGAFNKEQ